MAQVSTGVDVTADVNREDSSVPLVYSLNQNYPNPFGPATTITYSLAKREHVNISVYDLAGRHVRTLEERGYRAADHIHFGSPDAC